MNKTSGGRARPFWSERTARFCRDVCASVLATGLATIAFSHLTREPPGPGVAAPAGKIVDRIAWLVEDVPTRTTRSYDAIAMFGLPQIEPSAWSEPIAAQSASARTTPPQASSTRLASPAPRSETHAEAASRRPVAMTLLPPIRPLGLVPVSGPVQSGQAASTEPGRQPMRLLGWALPGSDLLPSARDTLQKVASLGDAVTSVGDSLVEIVGAR